MMLNTGGGAYSSKFRALEKDRLDKMRNTSQVVRVTVQDRARSLSLETNRRRRALELKKKLEAQKEAKRRQEILDDRKQRQHEATQKYQRLKSGTTRRNTEERIRGALYGTAYEPVKKPSSTWNNGNSTYSTPGLDDALRAVRGSPGLGSKPEMLVTYPQPQNGGTLQNYSYYQTSEPSGYTQTSNQQPLQSSNHSAVNGSGRSDYYHGFSTTPTKSNGYSSGTTAKSIYEKQIEDQQKNILEHNQKSLLEFNQAVLDESERPLRRSSSCSSVDSLEGNNAKKGVPVSKAYSTSILPSTTQTNHYTYLKNGVPTNATFNVQRTDRFDYRSSNYGAVSSDAARSNQHEVKLEETNEADIVQDQVDVNPRILYTSSGGNKTDVVLRNSGIANPSATRTTVAWSSPVLQNEPSLNSVSSPHSRPYSGKTTATAYTVEPAPRYQQNKNDVAKMNKPENNGDLIITIPKPELTVTQYQVTSNVSGTRDTVSMTQTQSLSTSNNVAQAPKSILKKGNVTARNSSMTSQRYGNYTMGRLGGAKVMDSLELRKASSMSDIGPSKKGIRWADLEYSSDDDRLSKNEQVRTVSSMGSKPKLTVQRANEGRISSAGSIQRSSIRSKPPVNKQSTNEPKSELRHLDINANQSVPSTNGNAIYGSNGLRLDRTPTDDEINWLWDKVRTCLNVRDEQGNPGLVYQKPPTGKQPTLSSQYIDGKRIGNNNSRIKPAIHSALIPQNNTTHPRRRTSSDTASSFLRRTALLQHRRQHATSLRGQNTRTSHHTEPVTSADVPSFTTSDRQNHGEEVSESLMLFQKAERLAQDDLSENEIAAAIDQQKKSTRPDMKGPSSLSIEEQRLMESLDRLNERLRITSEATSHLSATYAPLSATYAPPSKKGLSTGGAGFRGHRPLSSTVRTNCDIGNVKSRIRTQSADRASVRTKYRY
ncbi:uncharacterized protein [Antedon mediterranea]|uniref:uncharacterized protein n=1 Tax=Antedon mediterranea TaxID=105859 RepID=UPI003AF71F5F